MTLKKSVAVLSVAAVAAIATPTAALAHECYNANRSEQGNAGAANSQRWFTIETAEFFASAHEFLPVAPLTPAQIAQASALAQEQGIRRPPLRRVRQPARRDRVRGRRRVGRQSGRQPCPDPGTAAAAVGITALRESSAPSGQ